MLHVFKPAQMLRHAITGLAACLLIACGGGGSSTTTTPPTNTTDTPTATASAPVVSGYILDNAGGALAGARVEASGQSLVTGADGSYSFSLNAATTTTVVLVKKSGYATTAKELPVATGSSTQMNIKLFADQVSTSFNATSATSIPVGSARVQIPANAIKTASGADYAGTVNVGASYYSPDTVQGVQAFAGPYIGIDAAGVVSPIISMGFMEVKLTDAAGNPLQLKAPATLTFPPSSNSGSATSVPLWFYDESQKIWKNEGEATRQTDGSFQGTVAHFTLWNADFKGATATIKGCFRNANGQPIDNVGPVGVRTTGWSSTPWVVNANNSVPGDFTIINVPANLPLEFYSAASPPTFAAVAIPAIAQGQTRTLASCITASAGPSSGSTITIPTQPFTVTGVVTNPATGTASYAGNYAGTYGGAETGTFNVTVNAAGVISGSNFSQTYNQTFAVNGQVAANGSVALTASGNAGSARFGGSINAAGVISGTWAYATGLTGSGTFSGNRVAASVPAPTFSGVINPDKYVGTWGGCYQPDVGVTTFANGTVTTTYVKSTTTSSRDAVTFTKSGTNSLAGSSTSTDYNGTNCSGAGSNTQTGTFTMVIVGQKQVGADTVDLVNLSFDVSSIPALLPAGTPISNGNFVFKTIVHISGTSMRVGDDLAAPLDAFGYPTVLDPSPFFRQ